MKLQIIGSKQVTTDGTTGLVTATFTGSGDYVEITHGQALLDERIRVTFDGTSPTTTAATEDVSIMADCHSTAPVKIHLHYDTSTVTIYGMVAAGTKLVSAVYSVTLYKVL